MRRTPLAAWLEDRLDVSRLREKVLRKAFPVHHTFFVGELALFAFVTLVGTGIFLALNYTPSSEAVGEGAAAVPAAYASVRYLDGLPFGAVLRSVHHWSAHLMVAAAVLHLLLKLLSGGYKNPRELTWLLGLGLLGLTVVAAFTGYALPDDAFAVTATRIGYGIAGSLPWVGGALAGMVFGGDYPTAHSIPRLHALHVFLIPAVLAGLVAVHLLLVIKHKHQQPAYARRVAPGRVLGKPMVPAQARLVAVGFALYLGVVFAFGGVFPVHPVEAFGPPGLTTPDVKPDWYFLWIYGFLQLIPSWLHATVLGGDFGPELVGGVVVPGLLGGAAAALPFLDRSARPLRYLESPTRHARRTGAVAAVLTFFGVTTLGGYHAEAGLSLAVMWVLLLVTPPGVGWLTARLLGGKTASPSAL